MVTLAEEDIKAAAAENGFKDCTINEDGSVTYKMSKSKHKEMLNDLKSSFDESIASLLEGESAVAYVEGEGWYVMVCDSENDEDATATAYEDAVEEEKAAYFTEVYEGLEKAKFKVYEEVIETLDIAGTPVYGVEEETESETETAEGESASAESESESETAEGESETAESETEAE